MADNRTLIRVLIAVFATFLVFASSDALAYCRTTTCDPSSTNCDPPPGQACTTIGKELIWPNRCVGYSLQRDADPSVPFDTFARTTQRVFQSWLAADCGQGKGPSIDVYDLGPIACDAVEYNRYAGNANIIMFRSSSWPYGLSQTLALTTVTFNTENGHIYDVDIEVNTAQVDVTTTDENVKYDLEAILAHEVGHFFGLAHSADKTATMYSKYSQGSLDLRSPEPDDHEGLCAIYPPERKSQPCDPTPRHGLQQTCGDGQAPEEQGCSACALPAESMQQKRNWVWLVIVALGLGWRRASRRVSRG
ncbi:MAG TPA: matrixin family metalloprotease [Polyangiaceae bacterium]|jgi:hypothetical protein|nr:MAG: Matrixin [Deltaproteobacteria bacterium ADurb.Bin207]HNS95811.1 matrixin family metalloprotease [Polyangiaceae bacterium]HNZ24640.1 matrixin family metalloprotease [Polyangiaceae bacterium]HOD23228.1 matrixin family metalloprotease [Polyangiaceae bacterium]HOE51643.1 matrixin family metalloprotease [Polyangiaceae bacterium]